MDLAWERRVSATFSNTTMKVKDWWTMKRHYFDKTRWLRCSNSIESQFEHSPVWFGYGKSVKIDEQTVALLHKASNITQVLLIFLANYKPVIVNSLVMRFCSIGGFFIPSGSDSLIDAGNGAVANHARTELPAVDQWTRYVIRQSQRSCR